MQTQPGAYLVQLKDRTLTLQSPKLSALGLEKVLRPFFDRDLLMPREDEYRVSCSIFAPLQDALSRSRVGRDEVDICLLAGGSSLIPKVEEEVRSYFTDARMLTFPNRDDTQTAVAKGAALHALSLAVAGKAMFQSVCHDDIRFQTKRGPVILVPRGEELPYPAGGGFERRDEFRAPQAIGAGAEGEIRIELLAGDDRRPLLTELWAIPGPVKKGATLLLDFRFNENQVLEFRMGTPGAECSYEGSVENPLTHVVNPNADRSKIEDMEEKLRSGKVTHEQMPDVFAELADLYRKLRQYEKALSFYSRALQLQVSPSVYLLNRMAFCARDLGDREKAERIFLEADRIAAWSGTLFNWALAEEQWGNVTEALDLIERAIRSEDEPPYSVLKARLVQKSGNTEMGIRLAGDALQRFTPLASQSEFERSWFRIAAQINCDEARLRAVDAIQRDQTPGSAREAGEPPDMERMPGEDDE